jgi:hypothetical protein
MMVPQVSFLSSGCHKISSHPFWVHTCLLSSYLGGLSGQLSLYFGSHMSVIILLGGSLRSAFTILGWGQVKQMSSHSIMVRARHLTLLGVTQVSYIHFQGSHRSTLTVLRATDQPSPFGDTQASSHPDVGYTGQLSSIAGHTDQRSLNYGVAQVSCRKLEVTQIRSAPTLLADTLPGSPRPFQGQTGPLVLFLGHCVTF